MTTITSAALGASTQYLPTATTGSAVQALVNNAPIPTASQIAADKSAPPAQQMRDFLLKDMGVAEQDMLKMPPDARADLQAQMDAVVHAKLKENGAAPGAYVNLVA